MHQILQNLRSGETVLAEAPAPSVEKGHLLIRTRRTLVSLGTEKMLVQFGRASLLQKARSQPEKVRQVLQKFRSDGLVPTLEAVFRRLDEPLPLGYCNAGLVIGIGEGVTGFAVGDRVASNGPHAEVVSVPANLCAAIPPTVSDDEGAFTVAGAIALQGIRLARPELGERVVVIGLGLIGQLAGQLLKANGCRVMGFDFDREKVELAKRSGIEALVAGGEQDSVKTVLQLTDGMGADAVVITASTASNTVITESARMSRKRGRIVLIGVVGLDLSRADFYEKELSFQVSCSYGPGRYEDAYEEKGLDYPPAFVRWTENRNFQAVLAAMAARTLDITPLISRRVALADYREIYDHMDSGLGSLLVYGEEKTESQKLNAESEDGRSEDPGPEGGNLKPETGERKPEAGNLNGADTPASSPSFQAASPSRTIRVSNRAVAAPALAVVGAGNFTKMTALPALVAAGAAVKTIVSSGGVTGTALARKYDVPLSSTDFSAVIDDADIKGVIITTRHHLHAAQTLAALNAGKHVLVEKPLCLTLDELREIETAVAAFNSQSSTPNAVSAGVTVGYNRRFSPHIRKVRELLGDAPGPLCLVAIMNAGAIPAKHWVHDPEIGGGRLIGEACHFIDLALHIAQSPIAAVTAAGLGGGGAPSGDSASILLRHANGSVSTINYFANGDRAYPKERIEVFARERVLVVDDFSQTTGHGFRGFTRLKTAKDKGHQAQFAAFAARVKENGPPLIPWHEIANGTRATLAVLESIRQNAWVNVEAV